MYFQISASSDPKVIGVKNGIYQVELVNLPERRTNDVFAELINETNAGAFIPRQHQLFDYTGRSFQGVLIKNAKLTDVMGYSPYIFGFKFVASNSVRDIMERYREKDEFALFPVAIRTVVESYYALFVPFIPINNIVFSKSAIFSGTKLKKKEVQVEDYDDYIRFSAKDPFLFFEKVVLPHTFRRNMLCIQGAGDVFVSQNLADELRAAEVTGMEVVKSCELVFV